MKIFLRKLCLFLLKFLFPAINFKHRAYPLFKMTIWGIRQRVLFSKHRHIKWPVHPSSYIISPDKITIGTLAPGLAMNCYIDARNGIIFEDNIWIGPKASLISMNHDLMDYDQYQIEQPIIIRKNSILLCGCTILPGVELGEHTVVAAGAVVTKSFPEGNQLLAGVPASVIKKLGNYSGKI